MKRKIVQRAGAAALSVVLLAAQPGAAMAAEFSEGNVMQVQEDIFNSGEEADFSDEGKTESLPEFQAEEVVQSGIEQWSDDTESHMEIIPIPVTQEYFPDSGFRDWILENIDGDKDDILSKEEILNTEDINVSELGIDDLEGIEVFKKLKTLDCSGNMLRFLDLMENSRLESLDCSGNELRKLELYNKSSLKKLNVSGNTLQQLWLDNLPMLEELDVSYTDLDKLDLSFCPELKILNCDNASLWSLELGGNPKLESLSCSHNAVMDLDLSGLTQLKTLNCSESSLQSLNISSCKNLQELYCQGNILEELSLDGMTSLKVLNCSGNRLLYVDVQDSPLTSFSCSGNEYWTGKEKIDLKLIPGFEPDSIGSLENGTLNEDLVLEAVDPELPVVITYHYTSKGVSADETNYIYPGYPGERDFASPEIYSEAVKEAGANDIGRIPVSSLAGVTSLTVNDREITDMSDLKYFPKLVYLECSGNPISTLDLTGNPELRTLICTNTDLQTLDLTGNPGLTYAELYFRAGTTELS